MEHMPLWELREIKKSFFGVQALKGVSCSIYEGEVHALLGENGSGKSTLIKCVAGVHQPDSGEMLLRGRAVSLRHPLDARAHGVATIFQEFSVVPSLTVAENVFLGRQLHTPLGVIDWDAMRRETVKTLEQLEIHINPDAVVRTLSVAEQQLVEIAKAISLESTLLIMDEPTAALGLAETDRLLALVRRLAAQGKAILYISHRLDEVFEIASHVTVLKDGHRVSSQPLGELKMNDVVRMMVGVDIEQHYPKVSSVKDVPCLEVENLSTERGVDHVSFTINIGEVFGLGGMVGSGRTEIARALFGLDKPTSGSIRLHGQNVHFRSPVEAIGRGVGLIPENRKSDGLFFNFDAPPNITISRLGQLLRGPFMSLRTERQVGREYIDKLSITPAALEKSVKFLSGGNQQKVVIARWLFSQARLLILDEPTQGIDVGAKLDVYKVINELTAHGISILLISSDYPELLAMSDRVAVVRDGRILHIAEANRLSEYQLLAIASGAESDEKMQEVLRLRTLAMPLVHQLRDQLHETVHLAVLEREAMRLLYLDKFGGEQSIAMMSRTGGTAPLTCTGLGKVLLAYEPSAQVEAWFKQQTIPAFTETTITDSATLMRELSAIRENGFGLDREEHERGIRCIAAPVYGETGEVIAAISVTGSSERMPADLAQSAMRQQVVETALRISRTLGYRAEKQ
ncbi:MAG: ATP-binding cassette domain-containing protein [Chloroflexi bacterium]|nr:ATP-binding cassette domain-containing protein [Chloroflexota bacterium]